MDEHSCRTLVLGSSIAVYGECPRGTPAEEGQVRPAGQERTWWMESDAGESDALTVLGPLDSQNGAMWRSSSRGHGAISSARLRLVRPHEAGMRAALPRRGAVGRQPRRDSLEWLRGKGGQALQEQ
eukprot:11536760-Prorocentrum_lima.AAC.1